MALERFVATAALAPLKAFQRRTVDYVFERFYGSSDPVRQFLVADEVGLGKTIEAGLIIKELKARGVASRVLILAPSGIVSQWQYELRTKFNETFAAYNKASISFLQAENPGENVWTLRDNVITSTDYAAWDERRRNDIALAGWDLVIIDEAHHARRTREGVGKYRSTNLYRLAELLAAPDVGRSLGYLMLLDLDPRVRERRHRVELASECEPRCGDPKVA